MGWRDAPIVTKEEEESPMWNAAPVVTQKEGMGYLGKYYTEDIPGAVKGAFSRIKQRGERIVAPTTIGGAVQRATGTTGEVGGYIEGVAGAPERVVRTVAGAGGTLFEPIGIGTELALKSANRLSGGRFGKWAGKGVEKLTESQLAQKLGQWWGGLDEASKANFGAIPDLIDLLGLKPGGVALKAKKAAKSVRIGSENVPLPKGGPTVQRITGSLPGGRGAQAAYKGQVQDAVMKAASDVRGTGAAFEDIAEEVAGATSKALKKQDELFNNAFTRIKEAGTGGVKASGVSGEVGMDAGKWATSLRRTANSKARIFTEPTKSSMVVSAATPTGITNKTKRTVANFVQKIENLGDVSEAKRYEIFRQEKTLLGHEAFGRPSANLAGPDKDALRSLYRKAVELERNFIANQSSFWKADRDKILELFDATNAYYGKTKPIRDYTKRIVGYSEEIGERGHKSASEALRSLIAPNKQEELARLMTLLDDDAKKHLQNGLMAKFIDDALIENKQFISLDKLQKGLDKYGRKGLAKVVGEEKVAQIENLIDGMKKTGANKLKFADPSNPSGTGAAFLEKLFYTGTALGSIISPKVAAGIGATAYVNRLVSHIVFNQPLTALETFAVNAPGVVLANMLEANFRVAGATGRAAASRMPLSAIARGTARGVHGPGTPTLSNIGNPLAPDYTNAPVIRTLNKKQSNLSDVGR